MSLTTVHQIVLKTRTPYGDAITVSLYKGGVLVGDCGTHPADNTKQTLSCDKVLADRVELTMTNTKATLFSVYEITVNGDPNIQIGW